MKRGHVILIAGAALFVAGIVVAAIWAISFGASFLQDNTIVGGTTIGAGQSVDAKTDVNQLDRPISLAIENIISVAVMTITKSISHAQNRVLHFASVSSGPCSGSPLG